METVYIYGLVSSGSPESIRYVGKTIQRLSKRLHDHLHDHKNSYKRNWIEAEIKKGNDYLSFAKVDVYEKHKQDIKLLKSLIKKYYDNAAYNEIFNDVNTANNYVAYVGMTKKNNKKQVKSTTFISSITPSYISIIICTTRNVRYDIPVN